MPVTTSIIVPTYNHCEYVANTLRSVFAQTFDDYEVIVINDGSRDGTHELLLPYVVSGQIRYVRQENAGQAAARNCGLAEARGEFIAFLDDDDFWPPDKLARQLAAMRQSPMSVLAYGSMRVLGASTGDSWPGPDAPSGSVRTAFLRQNWIMSLGQTLIRAKTLSEVGGFDTSLWGVDDWDLLLRLADKGPFQYVNHDALLYRLHPANASKNLPRMYENSVKLFKKHRPRTQGEECAWLQGRKWAIKHDLWLREIRKIAIAGEFRKSLRAYMRFLAAAPGICLPITFRLMCAKIRLNLDAIANS